jgi:hypothetical protein
MWTVGAAVVPVALEGGKVDAADERHRVLDDDDLFMMAVQRTFPGVEDALYAPADGRWLPTGSADRSVGLVDADIAGPRCLRATEATCYSRAAHERMFEGDLLCRLHGGMRYD